MKKAMFFLIMIGCFFNLNAQRNFWDLTEAQLKTNIQRLKSQGSTPPQTRFNFYSDKMNQFFVDNLWKGDEILAIKELQISPPDDPSDWYYFVSIKTKRCATPFYCNYDIGDRVLGEFFMWDTRIFPKEFLKHVDDTKARLAAEKIANEEKAKADAVAEREKLLAESSRLLPEIIAKYSEASKQKNLAAIKTMKISGKTEEWGNNIQFEIWKQKPNKIKIISTFSNGYQEIEVFDGEKGYFITPKTSPREPREMTINQLKAIKKMIAMDDFFQNNLENLFNQERLLFEGEKSFISSSDSDNVPDFIIRDKYVDGDGWTYRYYIDKSTYLLLGCEEFNNGYLQSNNYFLNYTETNGILLPWMKQMFPTIGQKKYTRIEKVEINLPLVEGYFNPMNIYDNKGNLIDSKELRGQYKALLDSVSIFKKRINATNEKIIELMSNGFCLEFGSSGGVELLKGCYDRKSQNVFLAIKVLYNWWKTESNSLSQKNDETYGYYMDEINNDHLSSMTSYVDKNSFLLEWKNCEETHLKFINDFYAIAQKFKTIINSPEEAKIYNEKLKKISTVDEIKFSIGM